MNILLIYREFPDTFWSFKHALQFVGKRAALPPLGLLTIAAMLPHIYSPEHHYQRIRTFLREYQPPRIRGRIRFPHFLALLRSSYRLGLLGQERLHYWKLLLWTQFRRPRLFPEAVMLAICGHHFRKVCERRVW
jgi:hypothetical protein